MSKKNFFNLIILFFVVVVVGMFCFVPDTTTTTVSHQIGWWDRTTNWVGLTEHPTQVVVTRPNQFKIWTLGTIAGFLVIWLVFIVTQLIRFRSFRKFEGWLSTPIWCRKPKPEPEPIPEPEPEPSKV